MDTRASLLLSGKYGCENSHVLTQSTLTAVKLILGVQPINQHSLGDWMFVLTDLDHKLIRGTMTCSRALTHLRSHSEGILESTKNTKPDSGRILSSSRQDLQYKFGMLHPVGSGAEYAQFSSH